MDPNTTTSRPPLTTYGEVAALLEYTLVRPDLTNDDVVAGLEAAKRMGVVSACVRACDIDLAVRALQGSNVAPHAVCGFPHGTSNTAVKLYELRDLLRRGAKGVEMTINYSRLLSRAFQDVQTELLQASEACRKEGARLTVTLETHYLTDDLKVIACQCCERADVHAVRTATGFAPTLGTVEDLRLMRRSLPDDIGVEAAGMGTVDALLEAYDAGCTRAGAVDPAPILEEWKLRLARKEGA